MELKGKVKKFIDNQYKTPKGLVGTYIGEKMVWQHKPETLWTIELLNLQPGESVLELGCGSGYAMKLILEKNVVKEVVGLDLSPAVIRSAAIRNKKALKHKKAKLMQGDLKSLPCEDEHFEKVFSIHTIYFWDELSAAITEIFRVLKPGGDCTITFCNGKNEEKWEGINSMIDDQLIPLMKGKGFSDVALVKGPDSREFHTVAVSVKKKL
ncbi:ubiquinone/menaquinone biosynthesis C-methylase UbiE [Planomicrobium stackebrandtii]|uniref:Ubiquinone/menaquinone biosynthesis C-methylase UbiE n=1 Tax=Planomicrobium stackebrandtii TaxID=253160 RepID=A0ABU0H039_9BACL|nr:class I SAM-dependent methyltransferase [Planomicrobium stackebrandtii]MDQ0430162.1 ubiquinone/menaquinone biosynthesis C-methylase UbiE [Planomicrobium stackebrandtii]